MTFNRRQAIAGLGAIGASLVLPSGAASAQALPAEQMTLVVPFGSGSPPDLFARIFVEKLGRRLNRSVIVDLKPGASTTIGTAFAARSKPNGSSKPRSPRRTRTPRPARGSRSCRPLPRAPCASGELLPRPPPRT